MKIKRYDTYNHESDNGELVRYEDYVKAYLGVRRRLDEALDDIDWMERNTTLIDFPEAR